MLNCREQKLNEEKFIKIQDSKIDHNQDTVVKRKKRK